MIKAISCKSYRFISPSNVTIPSRHINVQFLFRRTILSTSSKSLFDSVKSSSYPVFLLSFYHSSKAFFTNGNNSDTSILSSEIEEIYPSMVAFLDSYIKDNFDELFHLFDEKKNFSHDEICLTRTPPKNETLPNDLLETTLGQVHTEYTHYYLRRRQGQPNWSNDLEFNDDDNSLTRDDVVNVLKQALIQVILDFHDGKPFGRTFFNSNNEFLFAHYLSIYSNNSSQLSAHDSSFYSLSIPKYVLMDLLSIYETMRLKDQDRK